MREFDVWRSLEFEVSGGKLRVHRGLLQVNDAFGLLDILGCFLRMWG